MYFLRPTFLAAEKLKKYFPEVKKVLPGSEKSTSRKWKKYFPEVKKYF